MALKIRLRQQGRRNRLAYRLVVTDTRYPRDGKYVEMVGHYDPHLESDVTVNEERIRHWVNVGAEMSEKATALVKRAAPSVIDEIRARAKEKIAKRSAKRKKK